MTGWKWWRKLEWHETALWAVAFAFAQDAPHFYSPLVQGVAIGLLAATLLIASARRFGLLVPIAAFGLWRASVMQPAPPVPAWQLTLVVFAVLCAGMLAVGAYHRWRNGRDEAAAYRA